MKDPFKVEAYLMAAFVIGIPLLAVLLAVVLPKPILLFSNH